MGNDSKPMSKKQKEIISKLKERKVGGKKQSLGIDKELFNSNGLEDYSTMTSYRIDDESVNFGDLSSKKSRKVRPNELQDSDPIFVWNEDLESVIKMVKIENEQNR